MLNNYIIQEASFKDPDAFVFINKDDGNCYRKINDCYKKTFAEFLNSGLYNKLLSQNLIVEHEQITEDIIKPEKVFISYPWEWCFSQFKDAALNVLNIQLIALDFDMSLKDANCFNMQFISNNPVLIDTSSFENYVEGEPWSAYRQFCENFIAPLALMAYKDISLNSLFLSNINGIPLELASKLLPFSTKFNLNLFTHIHLHSKLQQKFSENKKEIKKIFISKLQLKNIIKNLINTVENIKLPKFNTEWEKYYSFTNYSQESFNHKKEIINTYKDRINPDIVWDFGSNTGEFSRIFSNTGSSVFAFDIDKLAVERNYLSAKKKKEKNLFPLVFDLTNPSPALGWDNTERKNLFSRAQNVDLILVLALIHHLRFTYNIPFYKMAECFSKTAKYLIIEFVGKDDSKVQNMLLNRKDIFSDYNEENFDTVFSSYYNILDKKKIVNSHRILYLMEIKPLNEK